MGRPHQRRSPGISGPRLVDHTARPGPVAPVFTAAVGGAVIWDHEPTVSFVAPRGATGLTLNYAAPGGAYVAEGRSA